MQWKSDFIQFPRLIAEICATQENLDIDALAKEMDLNVEDVNELIDRAQAVWNLIATKRRFHAHSEPPVNNSDNLHCHENLVMTDEDGARWALVWTRLPRKKEVDDPRQLQLPTQGPCRLT
jgi:hypothetical protein